MTISYLQEVREEEEESLREIVEVMKRGGEWVWEIVGRELLIKGVERKRLLKRDLI